MSVAEQWRDEARARKARLWGVKVAPAPIVYVAPAPPPPPPVIEPPLALRPSLRISSIELVEAAAPIVFMDDVARAVCRYFGISRTDLVSRRQDEETVTPRHVAFYLCRSLTTKSFSEIGRFLGGRDHTTAISACDRVTWRMGREPQLAETAEALKAEILAAIVRRDTNNMIWFDFPIPPSVNQCFVNLKRGGRARSKAYDSWLKTVAQELLEQRGRWTEQCPVEIKVCLPEGMRGDADNRLKPIGDALVKFGVLPDDSMKYVKRISAAETRTAKPNRCVVVVSKWEGA